MFRPRRHLWEVKLSSGLLYIYIPSCCTSHFPWFSPFMKLILVWTSLVSDWTQEGVQYGLYIYFFLLHIAFSAGAVIFLKMSFRLDFSSIVKILNAKVALEKLGRSSYCQRWGCQRMRRATEWFLILLHVASSKVLTFHEMGFEGIEYEVYINLLHIAFPNNLTFHWDFLQHLTKYWQIQQDPTTRDSILLHIVFFHAGFRPSF